MNIWVGPDIELDKDWVKKQQNDYVNQLQNYEKLALLKSEKIRHQEIAHEPIGLTASTSVNYAERTISADSGSDESTQDVEGILIMLPFLVEI